MKVFFKIDKKYDYKAIWEILHEDDPAGTLNRAESMGISEEDLNRIFSQKKYDENDVFLSNLIESRYAKERTVMEEAVKSYQKAWDEINDLFSDSIEKVTGVSWKYDTYFVVLSPFNPGISNRTENTVVRSCFEDAYKQRRITAHEILMTHIWHIIDSSPNFPVKDEMKIWALNEMTTVAILSLEPSLNQIWGDKYDNFLQNYPMLDNAKAQIKDLYINKSSFDEYMIQSTSLVKRSLYVKINR